MTQEVERFISPAGFQKRSAFPDQHEIGELDEENELVLIKTPWNFDLTQLNGVEIPLKGRQVLATGTEKNIVVHSLKSLKMLDNISVVTKTDESDCVISGKLRFKKQIEIFECYDFPPAVIPDVEPHLVPEVENLRERFTPYGSGKPVVVYKRKCEVSDSSYQPSKIRKKKKHSGAEEPELLPKKKKKDKRKVSESDMMIDITDGDVTVATKVKKSKKHLSADELAVFSKKKKKDKRISESNDEPIVDFTDDEITVATKVKKSKKHLSADESDEPAVSSKMKKKKKKDKRVSESNDEPIVDFANDKFTEGTKIKKSKKHLSVLDELDEPAVSSKKKKTDKIISESNGEPIVHFGYKEIPAVTKHKKSKQPVSIDDCDEPEMAPRKKKDKGRNLLENVVATEMKDELVMSKHKKKSHKSKKFQE